MSYLFLIFLMGSLVGWLYEELFYWATEGLLRNRGVLYGPWLPIYGVGALGIQALKPLKKHPALLLLLCAGVAGVVEYAVGYVSMQVFGLRLWDYRGLLLNVDGIVCLRSVASFGVMGLAFLYLLEPACARLFRKLPVSAIRGGSLALLAVFLLDCILSALFRTPITY
ncbi:MAG: putative ABC transporter permease [Aristaeellaceae bacterium]